MLRKLSWIIIFVSLFTVLILPPVTQAEETPSPSAGAGMAPAPRQPDPSGSNTGNGSDVPAAKPGQPTMEEVISAVGHNRVAINLVWTLIAGFLVMFMQPGFAMVETGFTRA